MTNTKIHRWTESNVPDQSGKTFLITGANSGIGFAAANALASKRAHVIMACRNPQKAEQAKQDILETTPTASLDLVSLDLANLESVAQCAQHLQSKYKHIDCLINNAGLGWIDRRETHDGFEMAIGTNHFGHFALTSQIISLLKNAPDARVVSVASLAHVWGRIHFDDIHLQQKYSQVRGYGQSKLANLMFGLELQRQFEKHNLGIKSIIVHPGMSGTNIATTAVASGKFRKLAKLSEILTPLMTQPASLGCLPTLLAATSDEVNGGEYFGPKYAEIFGTPKKARIAKHAADITDAGRLWQLSETLTHVNFSDALAG